MDIFTASEVTGRSIWTLPFMWRGSLNNSRNQTCRFRKYRLTIFPSKFGGWSWSISWGKRNVIFSKRSLKTEEEAKIQAKETVLEMEDK